MSIPEEITGIVLGSAYIRPGTSGSLTGIEYVNGGWITVETKDQLDGIYLDRIATGQIAYVSQSDALYIAKQIPPDWSTFPPGPASVEWTEFNFPGGAGFPFSGSAIITGSLLLSGSFVDFTNATVISGSIFSGSFVGDGSGLTGIASSFRVSGSSGNVLVNLLDESLLLTGSLQDVIVTITDHTASFSISDTAVLSGTFSGSFSGSFEGDGSGLTGIEPFPYSGSADITGSLNVVGPITGDAFAIATGSTVSGYETGRFYWNSDEETMNLDLTGDVTLQLGQEQHYHVINQTGATINNGEVVYVAGVSSDVLSVDKFIADDTIEPNLAIGVATQDISDTAKGFVTSFGRVRGIDTSGFSVGEVIYASTETAGAFQSTRPNVPNHSVEVGFVAKVGSSDGEIYVRLTHKDDADEIQFNPSASTLLSTNVQNALEELDSSKASVDSLSSNIYLYPTTGSSPISGYFRMVTSTGDADYNTNPQDIDTGAISGSSQFIAALASDEGIFVGDPGVINITTLGNIKRTDGSGTAKFYFEVYQSGSSGEVLVGTSTKTSAVESTTYEQFNANALLDNGNWLSTERFVIKYYAERVEGSADPTYNFQFGGSSPVKTLIPVPVSVIPSDEASDIPVDTSNFDGILDANDNTVQDALDTIDDHGHTLQEVTDEGNITTNRIIVDNITADTNVLYTSGSSVGVGTTTLTHPLTVVGDGHLTGDFTVTGIITAEEFHTEFVSASIVFRSGSTKFGDTDDDRHEFNGRIGINVGSNPNYPLSISGSNNSTGIRAADNIDGEFIGLAIVNNEVSASSVNETAAIQFLHNDGGAVKLIAGKEEDFIGSANRTGFFSVEVRNNGTYTEGFRIKGDSKLQLGQYGSGTFTGTAAYALAVDASGNIIENSIASNPVGGTGTANRVAYWTNSSVLAADDDFFFNGDKVGIGTTNPATKLHIVQSGTAVSSDGVSSLVVQKSAAAGTAAAINIISGDSAEATLRFGDTTDNNIGSLRYLNSEDAFSIVTNNSEQVRIDSSGRVGIGETAPDSKLHVAGTVKFENDLTISGSTPSITFLDRNPVSGSDAGFIGTGGRKMTIYTGRHNKSRNDLWLRVGDNANSSTPTIFASGSNGYIGLGTETPSQRLTVQGNISASGLIYAPNIGAGVDNSVVVLDSDGTLRTDEIDSRVWGSSLVDGTGVANRVAYWSDANTLANDADFFFDGTSVGIGTTSPDNKLHVYKGTSGKTWSVDTGDGLVLENSDTFTINIATPSANQGLILFSDTERRAEGRIGYVHSTDHMYFSTTGSEAMRITSDGKVGIGTTAPTHTLQVRGAANLMAKFTSTDNRNAIAVEDNDTTAYFVAENGMASVGRNYNLSSNNLNINSTGNAGLGTTNPVEKLDVRGNIQIKQSNGGYALNLYSGSHQYGGLYTDPSADDYGMALVMKNTSTGTSVTQIEGRDGRDSYFNTGGNVGIGTTTPLNKFHVYHATLNEVVRFESGDPTVSVRLKDNNASGYISSGYGNLELHSDVDSQIADSKMYFKIDNSEKMRLQSNGHLGIGTTAPGSILDIRDNGEDGEASIRIANTFQSSSAVGEGASLFFGFGNTTQDLVRAGRIIVEKVDDYSTNAKRKTKMTFTTRNGDNYNGFILDEDGQLQLSQYGSGTFTGTAAYTLRVDSSGNIIEQAIGAGAVDGSGVANEVVVWKDTDTISGSGALTWNGSVLNVEGTLEATEKSFVINHPTQEGKKLVYGVLEGPEHAVYCRGKINTNVIELPEEWTGLVDEDTITVQLTSIGKHQNLYVEDIRDNRVFIKNGNTFSSKINAFYYVQGTRKDVKPLVTVRDK